MARPNAFIFFRDTTILFFGVLCASWLIEPIEAESTTTLVLVALVLALFNVVLKPILVLFALPFVIFTFGLGIFVINAVLLYLAGQLIPGFSVPGFGVAFLGALVISLLTMGVNLILSPRPKVRVSWNAKTSRSRSRRSISNKDVIDV
ncbi:phage holin family protein [Puniceicoccales bacterium CK1056]|uniref:Phage holin family protein n=1 Tax=Oceanipulchritudo coccoides TaxID=2706888 RepID=A0A6B2M0Q0_9BACT|nr:phage holin family protein [Oceanipulchritudo coccoides]NDV61972.1 phage holin family protein [Oceanipulchritudo coccoides]